MAAVVELDESNGASEVITHAVATLAMGTVDASGMTPGAPGARQPISSSSIQKALRLHLSALGGSLGITGIRVFCDPTAADWTLWTNCTTVGANYAASKVTTYGQPVTTPDRVPYALPEADPGTPNLGIAGSLAGQLTAVGWSDYCYLQLRAGAAVTASFTSPAYFSYDEIG